MVKGVIFDIGGVLAYDIREYLFYEQGTGLISKYGLDKKTASEVDQVLYEKYAYNKIGKEDNWQKLEEQYWSEVKTKIGLSVPTSELIEISKRFIRPVPGMMDLIKFLKEEEFDLLLCSNNCEFWFQRIKQALGLGGYFEDRKIILSNRFGASKADPSFALFKEIEKQIDYPKEKYLFVDDRKGNIERAIQFGITPIYFPAEFIDGKSYITEILKKIKQ